MMTIENSDMGDVTNGVATTTEATPTTAHKPKAAKRPVRTVASSVENPARQEFGFPTHEEKAAKTAGKKKSSHKKKPHKVSASPKHHAKKPVKAKATSKASHASPSGTKKHGGKKKHAHAAAPKHGHHHHAKKAHGKHAHKKRPAHWKDGKAQLVMHSSEELVRALDRGLPRFGKMLGIEKKATRGSVVRRCVELLVQGKLAIKK